MMPFAKGARALATSFALMAIATAARADSASDPRQARFEAVAADAKAEMLIDPRRAAWKARQAEPFAATILDTRARQSAEAKLLWLQGEALYRLDQLNQAAPLIARALVLAQASTPRSKLEADILLTRGSINGKIVRVAEALSDLQAAHRLFRYLGDRRSEAISLVCLANLYLDAMDYQATLRYLADALDAYHADPGLEIAIFNARGIVYQDQKLFDRADIEYRQALRYARQAHSSTIEGQLLRNIARNHLLAGQVAQADRAIAAARALPGNDSDNESQLDAVAAQAALQHGNARRAGQLIGRVFSGVDLGSTAMQMHPAHQTALATYRALHRPELALPHLQAMKRLDDEATRLATQTSTALMAGRFNSANQEAKIARLRLEENLQRARSERTLLLGTAGATSVVIVLLLIGVFTIRRSRDEVRAANGDLALTNQALGKALAAKTEFLATTSHEIRTPLNGILGMTQVMLADPALPTATRERLGVVHGAGLTMRALVDDILDVAKMETGNLALEHAPFDLAACLRDAALLWDEQARAKGLRFVLDLQGCPRMVEGDAARVRQIAFNLLSNALKFTAAGSVTLSAEGTDTGVRIAVADTGIGIAADKREAVFESFRQADTSTTRQFGGTGLGLSICRSLVAAMGGAVTLDSVEGRGSTFTVALPLPPAAIVPVPCASTEEGEVLLVIDRNPITRAMFKTLFAPHGTTAFAGSVDEAVACLVGGRVTRVLIDDGTARLGGHPHRFLAAVAAAAGRAETILLWPVAAANERDELLALGITRVIAKPITGAALIDAVFSPTSDEPNVAALVSRAA